MQNITNTIRKTCAALVLALGLVFVMPGAALAFHPKEVENIKTMLMAYDAFPSATDFKKVSTDPRGVLLVIWQDKANTSIVRLQALDALSLFPDEDVRALFREILSKAAQDPAPAEVHRAVNGLLHGFGESAVEDVAPLLQHRDVQVRLTVAHAVGTSGGASGRALLRAHLADEPNKVVREQIETLILEIR
jgi:HEAT repeat protein